MRWNTLLVVPGIAACLLAFPRDAAGSFVASDFEFVITTGPTFKSGDNVVFDGILTNTSSQTAVFGGNIAEAGASYFFFIGGLPGPASPYFGGISSPPFPNQSIAPGASIQFPFILIDTTPTIPPGTIVTLGPGNLLFQNIPPSTPDPFVDFFIPFSEASATASAAEPQTLLLLGIGFLIMFGFGAVPTSSNRSLNAMVSGPTRSEQPTNAIRSRPRWRRTRPRPRQDPRARIRPI